MCIIITCGNTRLVLCWHSCNFTMQVNILVGPYSFPGCTLGDSVGLQGGSKNAMVRFDGIRRRGYGDIEYKLRVSGGNYVECACFCQYEKLNGRTLYPDPFRQRYFFTAREMASEERVCKYETSWTL